MYVINIQMYSKHNLFTAADQKFAWAAIWLKLRFVFNLMFAIGFQKLLFPNVPHSLREFVVGSKDDNQMLS